MARLNTRVAIVIGAAGGIGAGIAARLASEGATVVSVDGVKTRAHMFDAIEQAAARHGRLDILINAPEDESQPAPAEAASDEDFHREFASSFDVTRWAMQAAFPHLRAQGGGHIVNIVSIYGVSLWRKLGAYSAASEAIKGFTCSAAEEWGPHGIHVNALLPAADTPLYRGYRALNPEAADRILQSSPMGRLGDPERDIGGAVLFLVTESGRYLTGHCLHVDGGQHLSPSPYEALIA